MKIEVTLAELNNVVDSLNKMVETPMPAKYAFRFGKVAKQLQTELGVLKEQRNGLYKKYGEETEDGKLTIPQEKLQDFYKEAEDLLGEKIEIDFDPMPLSVIENSEVSISAMAWLDKFFVDDLEIEKEETIEAS